MTTHIWGWETKPKVYTCFGRYDIIRVRCPFRTYVLVQNRSMWCRPHVEDECLQVPGGKGALIGEVSDGRYEFR